MKKSEKDSRLIGMPVKVTDSKNRQNIGLSGVIIDETRNMLTIETKKGVKHLTKANNSFEIEGKKIEGQEIRGRIEERIKSNN